MLGDALLARAGRYLALCAGLRRWLLHQRGRAGLVSFTANYDRYSRVQKAPGRRQDGLRALVPDILKRFEREGAVAVELRPTLDRTRIAIQHKLEAVVRGYFDYLAASASQRPVLMALVPSLFKQEGLEPRSDLRAPATWKRQSELWCAQVDALLAILDDVPALRWFVVGLDAAGRERGCPPRILAPALERVRAYHARHGLRFAPPGRVMAVEWLRALARAPERAPDRALAALNARPITYIRLGLTVHAGEDFVDPVTGLRHIWESLDALALGRGDRMGHALAAGLDRDRVRDLLERRGREPGCDVERDGQCFRLRKPRGVHLLDLAWMHRMSPHTPHERRLWAARLAQAGTGVLGTPIDAEWLAAALNAPEAPVELFVPAIHYDNVERLRPSEFTWVTLDAHWFEDFERLRRCVLDDLRRRAIVVESCPTSNMAVAGMREPPIEVFLKESRLRCVVATDDPGLLGAWLRHELEQVRDENARARLQRQAARASFVRCL